MPLSFHITLGVFLINDSPTSTNCSIMECCKTGSSAPANYQPRGHIQQIGPVDAYICGSASLSSRTLVLLPDGFGLVLHNFILADMFAQKGWDVVIPDYFEGRLLYAC